jgi:hypothetical protein
VRGLDLSARRLHRQLISRQPFQHPAEVVRWFGAVQAQDYPASLWALGLRTAGARTGDVEAALADGSVIRVHGFRGTWQHVAREDVRWMLALVGERLIAGGTSRMRAVGLAPKTLERAAERMAQAVGEGGPLTRSELAAALSRSRIASDGGRLMHLLWYAELRGFLCQGAPRGKQPTWAWLDDRVPAARPLSREAALVQLAGRYFQSRGPATDRDLAWWSGLPLGDARQAIALARPALTRLTVDGTDYFDVADADHDLADGLHLLPAFDECLIAYQDRAAFIEPAHLRRINNGGGILKPILLFGGRAIGIWRRTIAKGSVSVDAQPFQKLRPREQKALAAAIERYTAFLAGG